MSRRDWNNYLFHCCLQNCQNREPKSFTCESVDISKNFLSVLFLFLELKSKHQNNLSKTMALCNNEIILDKWVSFIREKLIRSFVVLWLFIRWFVRLHIFYLQLLCDWHRNRKISILGIILRRLVGGFSCCRC